MSPSEQNIIEIDSHVKSLNNLINTLGAEIIKIQTDISNEMNASEPNYEKLKYLKYAQTRNHELLTQYKRNVSDFLSLKFKYVTHIELSNHRKEVFEKIELPKTKRLLDGGLDDDLEKIRREYQKAIQNNEFIKLELDKLKTDSEYKI